MIVVSPPPSPAARFQLITPPVTAQTSGQQQQPYTSGSMSNPNSNRSSPSPRLSSRHHHQLQSGFAPKPAQVQRLHGSNVALSSPSSSLSPAHSPVSPSFDLLSLPHYPAAVTGGNSGGGSNSPSSSLQGQTGGSKYSPRLSNLALSSSSYMPQHPGNAPSSQGPPPITPSSPVSNSLLFNPSYNAYDNQSTVRHQHQLSLPPPASSSPSHNGTSSSNYTTHSLQSSPRLHSRLNTITSPRSIITTSPSSSAARPGSGENESPTFPSPGLATARPPLTFHNTDSTSSSSGDGRSFAHQSSLYHQSYEPSSRGRPPVVISTSIPPGRSATRSPPPPTTSSLFSQANSTASSSSAHSYNPFNRTSSPDSVASSAFAYTASNTTNSLSYAFHSALQLQQQQQQQTQQSSGQAHNLPTLTGFPSRQQTGSTLSQYSRPAGSSASLASSSLNLHASSAASSRPPSRRPSIATLQSFLEGVNHVTRVRSPSLRGHSRSGSFDDLDPVISSTNRSASVLSLSSNKGGSRPWHLDDVDEIPSWEQHNDNNSFRAISPTPRNRSYLTDSNFNARHRNGSAVSIRRDLYTPDNEYGPSGGLYTSPQPIVIGGARRNDSYDEEYDEYAERTFVDRRDMTLFPDHIKEEDEQRHLRNLDEGQDGIGGNHAEDDYSGGSNLQPHDFWTEQDLNSLQEGDRLGIGLSHEGYPVVDALIESTTTSASSPQSPFRSPDDGIQFEVVRQLGYGSYAIVYLVKEILYEPDHEHGDHDLFPHHDEEDGDGTMIQEKTIYGREFALKCLSKRNLTDEQIRVQKFEATLHRALPIHSNVVALHRAMETPAWLFLVLEYCPGQDLFFWLEQARDHEDIDFDPSRAPSRMSNSRAPVIPPSVMQKTWHHHGGGTASAAPSPPLGQSPHFATSFEREVADKQESTPPSPSLLSASADTALLSRRRLRLISRMFVQMCEALQACHDAGVAHRDIKPENIIIVDNRAELGSAGKVVIKITDWGLGTTDERCEDFDCGSKPYMAYECRNNLMPSYEPKGADVWSLGIVLLNLLFHRCPWADPTLDDPDFYAFRRDPINFLETRFEGIGSEVATFLANRVFCDVEEVDSSPESMRDDIALPSSVATATPFTMRRGMPKNVRVTAGEFAKWATKLVRYMGEGSRRASISDSTRHIVHTVRQSPRIEAGRAFQSPPARSPRHSVDLQRPSASFADDSPSRKHKRLSIGLPNDLMEELEKADNSAQIPAIIAGLASAPEHSSPLTQSVEDISSKDTSTEAAEATEQARDPPTHTSDKQTSMEVKQENPEADAKADEEGAAENESEICAKEKSRRRKRGARKGRGHHREKTTGTEGGQLDSGTLVPGADGEVLSEEGASLSPESPNLDIVDTSKTLQAYAREISQTTKPPLVTSASYTPGLVSEISSGRRHTSSTSALTPPSNTARSAPATKSRFADKLKSAFANGNPELQAFAARAKERDMAFTGGGERNPTSSAPAKMQHTGASFQHPSSQISSFGSVASSTGSWSEDGTAAKHWASTSSRRVRVDKTKRQPEDGITNVADGSSPPLGAVPGSTRSGRSGAIPRHQYAMRDQASTAGSSPSPSRRSFTPISSFSSATSYESPSGIANSSRTARSPLQSIDETVYSTNMKDHAGICESNSESRTPLAGSVILEPIHRPMPSNPSSHVIREPKPPPLEMPSSNVSQGKPSQVIVKEQPVDTPVAAAPSASRAKIGKFFNKFSRT